MKNIFKTILFVIGTVLTFILAGFAKTRRGQLRIRAFWANLRSLWLRFCAFLDRVRCFIRSFFLDLFDNGCRVLGSCRGDLATNTIGAIIIAVVIIGLAIAAINAFFPGFFTNMFTSMQQKLNANW